MQLGIYIVQDGESKPTSTAKTVPPQSHDVKVKILNLQTWAKKISRENHIKKPTI